MRTVWNKKAKRWGKVQKPRPLFERVKAYLDAKPEAKTIPIHPDDADEAWTAMLPVNGGRPVLVLGDETRAFREKTE